MADNIIEDFTSNARRVGGRAVVSAFGSVFKDIGGYLKVLWGGLGVPIAAGLLVLSDIWNYTLDKEKITREYTKQIAARRGIMPQQVGVQDMMEEAQENPTLGETLKRSKTNRNLDIAVDVLCTVGAFALAYFLAAPAAGLLLGVTAAAAAGTAMAVITGIAISFCSFFAGKLALTAIGKKATGLSEPGIKMVEFDPSLQSKLSLPSQVLYIDHLQRHGVKVFPSQIMEVFAKAHPDLSPQEIQQRYDIGQIARDINDGLIYAKELAFSVYGQQSGVPRLEARPRSEWEKGYAAAQDHLAKFGHVARNKAGEITAATAHKAAELGETASNFWRSRFASKQSVDPAQIAADRAEKGSPITPENIAARQNEPSPAVSV